ncbi:MAG: transposase [Gammaproteobacteria bacterium]|nr:transposase [Gammaproteobacteria bacterium]
MKKLKEELKFDYILRIKRNFTVTDKQGIKKLAYEWLNLQAPTCIDDGKIRVENYAVKKVVICKEPGMKEMWCLVCSITDIATQTILTLYGKRWTTECSYRDEKDLYFGMGLKKVRVKKTARRQRLLLISAIVIILLTVLGAASEAAEFDKYFKANTVKQRTHSLFAQGRLIVKLLPTMADDWKLRLMANFLEYSRGLKAISVDQFVV